MDLSVLAAIRIATVKEVTRQPVAFCGCEVESQGSNVGLAQKRLLEGLKGGGWGNRVDTDAFLGPVRSFGADHGSKCRAEDLQDKKLFGRVWRRRTHDVEDRTVGQGQLHTVGDDAGRERWGEEFFGNEIFQFGLRCASA